MTIYDTREGVRLVMNREKKGHWNRWGPFLSARAWGTVREDYSADGEAWTYFPHDHARSRAYRWNEDGLAGICDRNQHMCFALALWNGKDPILKERMFGLNGSEGNHGEDVKEYWYYLDNLPSHAYMKMLYKYPQAEYPYQRLIDENRRRSKQEMEYELVDTGIFDEGRYFDVVLEYAKAESEDLLDPHQCQQPRPGSGGHPHSADAVVSQHMDMGPRRAPTFDHPGSHRAKRRQDASQTLGTGRLRPLLLRR